MWRWAGGEDGIRTHEKLLTSTPLAGERLRPLGHLSVAPLDKEKERHNQQVILHIGGKMRRLVIAVNESSAQLASWGIGSPTILRHENSSAGSSWGKSRARMAPFLNDFFMGGIKSCHLCNMGPR